MWGHMWSVPFDPVIWGTVAAWFGALLTVLSAVIALWRYWINLDREEHAQARHIVFTSKHWTKYTYHALLQNFSDESIFEVEPTQQCIFEFREVLERAYREFGRPLTTEAVEKLRAEWKETPGGTYFVQTPESGHVKAGESKDIKFHGPRSAAQAYSVTFRDSKARKWELQLDCPEPCRVSDDFERGYRLHDIFCRPREYLKFRTAERKLNKWLDQNVTPK